MNSKIETTVSLASILYHKTWGYFQDPCQLMHRVPRGEPVPLSVAMQSFLLDPPTHICDNIFLGNALHATTESTLRSHNITAVVNVSREIPCHFKGIEYCWIPVDDVKGGSLLKHIDTACEFISSRHCCTPDLDISSSAGGSTGNILIHCFMGASRSVAVLTHYLLRTWPDKSAQEILAFIKTKRPVVNMNQDFYQEIHNLRPITAI